MTYLAIWSMWSGLLVRELIPSSSLFSPISNSELPAALSAERNLCCSRKAVSSSLRQSSAAVSITALPANTVWESSWWQHSSISNITCTHAVHQLFISEQYSFIIIFYLKMKIKVWMVKVFYISRWRYHIVVKVSSEGFKDKSFHLVNPLLFLNVIRTVSWNSNQKQKFFWTNVYAEIEHYFKN